MLPLLELHTLATHSELISRFTMAVKKVAFAVADEQDQTTNRWLCAQKVAQERGYQKLALQVIDYASAQAGNALSETGATITDAQVEAVVQAFLSKVVRLIMTPTQ